MGLYITLRIFIVLPSAFTFGIARDGSLNELSSSEPVDSGVKKTQGGLEIGERGIEAQQWFQQSTYILNCYSEINQPLAEDMARQFFN